jgi:predicted GNAT family N-acyltransferase
LTLFCLTSLLAYTVCFSTLPLNLAKVGKLSASSDSKFHAAQTTTCESLKMSINVKVIATDNELREALGIRKKVFVDEQKVAESDEIDEFDSSPSAAIHFLALRDGKPAATARVRFMNDGTRAKIQRVATLIEFRKQGIGHVLMRYIADHLRAHHRPPVQELYLEAQVHAIDFYQKLGFEPFGEEFLDVGIPHRAMRIPA